MDKYICIHGHFYQPPRENPWLETIELQDSAYPFHDWNERINAECYAPNSASRIVSGDGKILQIVNNYAKMSFNFGPTLLAWMEHASKDVHDTIVEADRLSMEYFSGHGSALAQVYNHIIMPLANPRDKFTSIYWAIQDFEHRFGRKPQGLWLAETAVDIPSLEIMAEQGILFTILSPYQAKQVRELDSDEEEDWEDVTGANIDPTRAYQINLPSERSMALFFYDAPVSQAIAFERLLSSGENFANRLIGAFNDERTWPQLVHIATDGETYGHHHKHGDMALAYAIEYIEKNEQVKITNYGEFLEKHPPTHEVEIYEGSAWSCAHGVGRWMENCGCNTGMNGNWNQEWRKPLREALDWLREKVNPLFETEAKKYFKAPWDARNEYIHVILNRSPNNLDLFFSKQAVKKLTYEERVFALKLMEMQRHELLMYTSCGWFFDEISGIETVQVIMYAGRVIQLAKEFWTEDLEGPFLQRLEQAKSNISENMNGRVCYERYVKPSIVDLPKVAAHYALSSIFETYENNTHIFQFNVNTEDYRVQEVGNAKLVVGRATVTSEITCESERLSFGVLHLGDHNLYGGIRKSQSEEEYKKLSQELKRVFSNADFAETIRYLDRTFGTSTYSLKQLFRDEQRKIINTIMESTVMHSEAIYRQMYEPNVPMMSFLTDIGVPLPISLRMAADFVLNTTIKRELQSEELNSDHIQNLIEQVRLWNIHLDVDGLSHAYKGNIERVAMAFSGDPRSLDLLRNLLCFASLLEILPFEVNLWRTQNIYWQVLREVYPEYKNQANNQVQEWVDLFEELGQKLGINI